MRRTWILLIALILLVGACSPGQSPEQVQAQVNTAVAQTMAAQQLIADAVAETVAAQNALATPTQAFTPTVTNTPLNFPTLTPFASATPFTSSGGSSGGGGGSYQQADYSCDIIHQRPRDQEAIYSPGDDFDIKWTILNTGSETWPAGYDVKYYSGPNFTTTGVTVVELPEMKPKAQYEIVFDAVAPMEKGHHVMTWVVEGQLCWPYTALDVQ